MNTVSQERGLAGIVLAAGRSQRMGVLKQTLLWPPTSQQSQDSNLKSQISNRRSRLAESSSGAHQPGTIISWAFDAIAAFVDRMFVVVGQDADAVLAALGDRSFTRVHVDSNDEMVTSIRAGLRAASQPQLELALDAVLLQPGDHPVVSPSTIDAVLHARHAHAGKAIMPEYRGRGGHPVLIPKCLIFPILSYQGSGGLRQFWIDHPQSTSRLPVDDPLCVADFDTPEQYQAAWRCLEG